MGSIQGRELLMAWRRLPSLTWSPATDLDGIMACQGWGLEVARTAKTRMHNICKTIKINNEERLWAFTHCWQGGLGPESGLVWGWKSCLGGYRNGGACYQNQRWGRTAMENRGGNVWKT